MSSPDGTCERAVLSLYPQWWRDRYGEEFLALLAQSPTSMATFFDVARGAIDARINNHGNPGVTTHMPDLRRQLVTSFAAFAAFSAAGFGLSRIGEGAQAHVTATTVRWSWLVMLGAATIASALMVIATVVLARAVLRDPAHQSLAVRQWAGISAISALALPAATAGYAAIIGWHEGEATTGLGRVLPLAGLAVLDGALLTGVVVAGAMALRYADLPVAKAQPAVLATMAVPCAMALCTGATIAWGLGLRARSPEVFSGPNGFVSSNLAASWLLVVIAMGLSTALAVKAAISSRTLIAHRAAR